MVLEKNLFLSEGPEEEFTKGEIETLKSKLDELRHAIEIQAEKVEASEKQIEEFKSEIENIKSAYLRGRISKIDFGFQRQRIDIKLEFLRDLAHQAGIDWETL